MKSLLQREIEDHMSYSAGVVRDMMRFHRESLVADAVLAKFPEMTIRASLASYGGVTITIGDILKISDVKEVLRFIVSEFNIHLTGAPKKRESYKAGWTWEFGDNLRVVGTFKDAPEASCRLVKVGTKTVEQDVLEMQCSENGATFDEFLASDEAEQVRATEANSK